MSDKIEKISIFKTNPTSSGQVLYFFGVRHSNNPNDTQFNDLKKYWDEFVSISRGERIIFTEGPVRPVLGSYEDSIKEGGEVGGTQWLANKDGVPCLCPEPNDIDQRKIFCTLFDQQLVAYSLILQSLSAWYKHSRQSTFLQAVDRSINREAKSYADIYGFIPDKTWFLDQHKKIFGEQELNDKKFLDLVSDPTKNDTVVNKIIAQKTKIRNEYLLSAIMKAWKEGKSIFVEYGRGHLDALEDSLRKINL